MGAPKLGEEKLLPRDPDKRAARVEWLRVLYVEQRLTTIEIGRLFGVTHKSVHRALRQHGIATRKAGTSRHYTCMEPGCNLQAHKVKHATNGSMYGRRCKLHWIAFRMEANQRYNDKHLGKDDEAWLRRMRQSLRRVQRVNREVSQSLKAESQQATTSRAACRR